ncbi:MAG TPA: hypothetical protein VIB39_01095 [Candidatus Angelobacter sp.]|jgi:hypothetical protein
MMTSLDDLNAKVFREQLHTQFKVNAGGQPLSLELIEVTERQDSPRTEFFSLHFRGPISPRLPQQIHRLEHARLGTFEIFLTTISADEQGTVYEAIFHRFRKQS